MTENTRRILVLCTGNSARSQMAEALLKHMCQDKYVIDSAGTKPSVVRPEAITVIGELDIDISDYRSKSVDQFSGDEIDFVLTVCDNAKESCPLFPAKTKRIHKAFEDPASVEGDVETRLAAFRKIRDQINSYLPQFLKEIGS